MLSAAQLENALSSQDTEGDVQEQLSRLNEARLQPRADWSVMPFDEEFRLRDVEKTFLEREREAIAARAASSPSDPDAFIDWFEELREKGPGQNDPLFDWLAAKATLDEIGWFLSQEVAGEAGFDDLVALTQIKLPVRPKLEMARNYWDEMGRGREGGMHGPMLDRMAAQLSLGERNDAICWEATAVANLLVGLAANRVWAYHSVGALGVVELTAPGRAARVSAGLERLGVPLRTRRYYALHATLDVRHSAAWNAEIIRPLVAEDGRVARNIAEGALMRLNAGARSFGRYRAQFGRTQFFR